MQFYCGIDLSARASQVCVIDKSLSILVQQKAPNSLEHVIKLLEPYKADLRIVVESTFNWYWLVDGLRERFRGCISIGGCVSGGSGGQRYTRRFCRWPAR